jgi:hypothetical protein
LPIHEFRCDKGHVTEKLFLTLKEAEETEKIICEVKTKKKECGLEAMKIISAGAFLLWGSPEGYHKPSPTAKRTVNPESISYSSGKTGDWVK